MWAKYSFPNKEDNKTDEKCLKTNRIISIWIVVDNDMFMVHWGEQWDDICSNNQHVSDDQCIKISNINIFYSIIVEKCMAELRAKTKQNCIFCYF